MKSINERLGVKRNDKTANSQSLASYVLDCGDHWVNFKKSHIKKISLIKE